ncbi:hypothetical protein, partial [Geobacillus sp. Geo 8.1]
SLSTQETEYSVSCVKETGSLSIPNPFQRYPIYLTLHKILDGTIKRLFLKLIINLYSWSLIINLLLMQNRRPLLSLIFSLILIWILFRWYCNSLQYKKFIVKGVFIFAFALLYFAFIQITRSGGFGEINNVSKLFFEDLIGYFLGSYNRLAALITGNLYFPGGGVGYYWTQWFWEFPILTNLLQLKDIAKEILGNLPPSGYEERYVYMEDAGLNSRYTAITIFAHSFVDFGWLGFVPFMLYGALSAYYFRLFILGNIFGVILYPYILWSILEWRGYIEITRPEIGLIFFFTVLTWLVQHLFIEVILRNRRSLYVKKELIRKL